MESKNFAQPLCLAKYCSTFSGLCVLCGKRDPGIEAIAKIIRRMIAVRMLVSLRQKNLKNSRGFSGLTSDI
jgi:hypothetical protein